MDEILDFTCSHCGNKTYAILENEYEKSIICKECCEGYVLEQKMTSPIVECPYCHSVFTQKIPNWRKSLDKCLFEIQPKEWHCDHCDSDF